MGNLEGLFDYVNTQVGEIAVQVGNTPAAWNAGVFSLIRQLSETVILPIAGLVLTFVATYDLIQMLLEKNNMHEFDVANIYKWMFKTACAILILSNTFSQKHFSMFLSGMNKRGITYYLNDHGVLCPTAYKKQQGLKYNAPNAQSNPMWSTITIDTILKNRVYVGDMVQGRQRVKSYKIHIQERVPEEEWFIVENTHEAIIDRETFDKVQGLLKRDTRTSPKEKQLYLFSGFLKCADCGRAMSRIASKGIYVYYQCGTYKSLSKKACTMHSIKSDRLEAGVLFAIQQQVHLAVAYSELVSRINSAPLKKSKSKRLEDAIAAKEKELAKIMRYKQALYQDWKDGEITRNDYRHMSEDYERQAEALNNVLRTLTDEQEQLENGVDAESPFLAAFLKYQNIDKLTREILAELIDYIKVYEGGNISVKFKYADEFRRMAEYIELNAPMVQEAAG